MMSSIYAQGPKDAHKSVKILPKAETKALDLNKSSNSLPNVGVLNRSSVKSQTPGEISFNQKWAITSAGLAPRVGLGPNASSRKKHTVQLKRQPVKVKHEHVLPNKKKSKWEGKVIKSDIMDIEDMDIPEETTVKFEEGDDYLYYTNVASEVVYEPMFNPNDYLSDWYEIRESKKSTRTLFPRDTTRFIRNKKGKVKMPFKSSYSVNSYEVSWKRALNSPVGCAKFVMKVIAPHEASQPMFGQNYNIEDLLHFLPAGYHVWVRTSPSTYEAFCNRGFINYEMVIDSKVLIIENLKDRSHVWVGIKPNFPPMSFFRYPKKGNNNLLILPNLEPGLDPKQVKISIASKGVETTCAFFGNDFRTVQAMIEEGNAVLKQSSKPDMDWEKVIEPANLRKIAPVTCNAVGIDQSRHWARLWFGQNPFPQITSNLSTRMILYKQLTADYPSVMPFKPQGSYAGVPVKRRGDLKIIEQEDSHVKGTYELDGKKKDYYVTQTFTEIDVVDDDDAEDWEDEVDKMLNECKLLLATAGLTSNWKGVIMNWNHDDAPVFWDKYSKGLEMRDFYFVLPNKSVCIPNPNLYEKDGKVKTNHLLIHRSGDSKLGTFRLSNGYNIIGEGFPNRLQVSHYMPVSFKPPLSEIFHLSYPNKLISDLTGVWHKELQEKLNLIIEACQREKFDVKNISHDKICYLLSFNDYFEDPKQLDRFISDLEGGYEGDGSEIEDRTDWGQQWRRATYHRIYSKLPEKYHPKPNFPLPEAKDEPSFSQSSEKEPQNKNNDNAHNASDAKSAEEEEVKDNYEDFFKSNMSKAKVIKRKGKQAIDSTKKKLIELVQTIRETFEQYLRTSKGRIVGWRAKLKNFVDRLVGLFVSVIKNFDKSNIVGSIIHIAQAFFKYMINPDPSKVPEMPDDLYSCALCDAQTSNVFTKTDEDLSICNNCLECSEYDKCSCSKMKSKCFADCYGCAGEEEKICILKVGKIYNGTSLGTAVRNMTSLEMIEKYELPKELSAKERSEKLVKELCKDEEDSKEEEEEKEIEKEPEVTSSSTLAAPCLEVITAPISPPVKTKALKAKKFTPPSESKSGDTVSGFSPWIRQNWDYSSAAKAGTGFFTSLFRNVRNTLNSLDEDINFKVGDEKTAMFWCYREVSRLKLNKANRRPRTLSKIEMLVKEPTVVCYEVLCGTGRVETMMGESLIRNISSQKLVVCLEGLENLSSTHPQIIRPDSKLDAAFALSVQNSNSLNVINVDTEVTLQTKQFYIIKCCERLQNGVVNQLPNNNNAATT